jgi:DNA-binding GntR family transcriptional regulator
MSTNLSPALLALAEAEADVGVDANAGAGERTYALLRAGILRDILPSGTLLAEADLAASLNISRTPVRSALQMLLQEGLVELGSRRQLYVRGFAAAERREVIMLRKALERLAVAEASKVITLNEVDELRLVLIRQRRAADQGNVEGFIDLDDQFHLKLAVGARLPTLQKFLGQLRAFTRMMGLRVATFQGRMYEVLDEHEAIVDALEAHDEGAAVGALDRHLAATYALLAELEKGQPSKPGKRAARKR